MCWCCLPLPDAATWWQCPAHARARCSPLLLMCPRPTVMPWGRQQQQGWLQVMGWARGQATLPLQPPGNAAHPAPEQTTSSSGAPQIPHAGKSHQHRSPRDPTHRAVLSPRNKTPQSWRSPGASLRGPKGAGTTRDAVHGACLPLEAARLPALRGCCVPASAPAPACPDPSTAPHRLGRLGKTLSTISHLSSNTLITPQSWPPK